LTTAEQACAKVDIGKSGKSRKISHVIIMVLSGLGARYCTTLFKKDFKKKIMVLQRIY